MADLSQWNKKLGKMQSPWFDQVDPNKLFPEYPRPQMVRDEWLNLNGLWDFKITKIQSNNPLEMDGKILVPFPVESPLSGVMKPLLPNELLWYRRKFELPTNWKENKVLLNFGAVDWECKIWINRKLVGSHKGGYSPFSFDISDFIVFDQPNEIAISVFDPTDKGRQPYGKQTLKPKTVFYTASSGIWQTVWLEKVSKTYIESFKITPDIDNSQITIGLKIQGDNPDSSIVKIIVSKDGYEVTSLNTENNISIILKIDNPKLWSPESPDLYDLELILNSKGQIDKIKSYFAMRKFSLQKGPSGIPQFFLNNKPYFMIGTLDQGFWPDGIYTAPSDAALLWDIEITKKFGFNMIRKHIKTEPARWYHYCDKLGIIVWQDMPNGGNMRLIPPGMIKYLLGGKYDDTTHHRKFGFKEQKHRLQFEKELKELVDSLYNVPSIAIWVTFNEAWGQFDAKRIANWLIKYDPTRLVDHASGWYDQEAGHFLSVHNYNDTFRMPKDTRNRGVLLSETGGYTLGLKNHMWNPKKKFGYKSYKNKEELHQAYRNMVETILGPSIQKGLCGVVYTQTSDVEIEYNGLVSYDRQVIKMDPDIIRELNMSLREIIPKP